MIRIDILAHILIILIAIFISLKTAWIFFRNPTASVGFLSFRAHLLIHFYFISALPPDTFSLQRQSASNAKHVFNKKRRIIFSRWERRKNKRRRQFFLHCFRIVSHLEEIVPYYGLVFANRAPFYYFSRTAYEYLFFSQNVPNAAFK